MGASLTVNRFQVLRNEFAPVLAIRDYVRNAAHLRSRQDQGVRWCSIALSEIWRRTDRRTSTSSIVATAR